MTERLYYQDSYLKAFDAQVLECKPNGSMYDVLLDRSAFYPTSGGQPFDTGVIGGARVVDVNVINGEVWHTVTEYLPIGEMVHGQIDWPRRFDHMQQHAADHMIAGVLHRLFGGITIGLHIGEDVSTIDVAMPDGEMRISKEDIRTIELRVNEQIQRNVPIKCWFPSAEELAVLPLRKDPTVSENIRVVAIGEDEMVACGGTHPLSAGELGLVKIISTTPARGKMRVTFFAGQRALKDYHINYESAHSAAEMLSSSIEQLPANIAAMQEKLRQLELEIKKLKRENLFGHTKALVAKGEEIGEGKKLITGIVDTDAALLREMVSNLIEEPNRMVLMGARNGEMINYVFGRSEEVNVNMGSLLRESAGITGGKGGGRPELAQGSGTPEMLSVACRLLKEI